MGWTGRQGRKDASKTRSNDEVKNTYANSTDDYSPNRHAAPLRCCVPAPPPSSSRSPRRRRRHRRCCRCRCCRQTRKSRRQKRPPCPPGRLRFPGPCCRCCHPSCCGMSRRRRRYWCAQAAGCLFSAPGSPACSGSRLSSTRAAAAAEHEGVWRRVINNNMSTAVVLARPATAAASSAARWPAHPPTLAPCCAPPGPEG